jgi:hypothetical protein
MRLFLTVSTFFLLTFFISACTTPGGGPDMMWKSQAGQYGENVWMFDQGVKTFEQADDMQIYAVCEALLETRDYGRLFPCLDNMDRRIEQGTYSVFMMPTEGMALMSKLLRVRGFLDLGEIEKALAVAESTTLPNTITGKSAYWLGYYGIRALTHALSGNREKALVNLSKLEEEDNFLMKKGGGTCGTAPFLHSG